MSVKGTSMPTQSPIALLQPHSGIHLCWEPLGKVIQTSTNILSFFDSRESWANACFWVGGFIVCTSVAIWCSGSLHLRVQPPPFLAPPFLAPPFFAATLPCRRRRPEGWARVRPRRRRPTPEDQARARPRRRRPAPKSQVRAPPRRLPAPKSQARARPTRRSSNSSRRVVV